MTTLMYFLNLELIAGNSLVGALSYDVYKNVRYAMDMDNDDISIYHSRYYGFDR